jgi:endonuclease G
MKRLLLALSFVFSFAIPSLPQVCHPCEIPTAVRAKRLKAAARANDRAKLKQDEIIAKHFPFGLPRGPASAANEDMLVQNEWIIWYDADLRQPLWVAYEFTRAEAKRKKYPRLDCFRRDPRLPDDDASSCEDYKSSGFDRGHLLPANDAKRSAAMMDNSFLLSNMAPQLGNFNQKIWMRLETHVNNWAETTGVNVITGAIFDRDDDRKRDSDSQAVRIPPRKRVARATHFYKIIIHRRPNGVIDTISFIMPHDNKLHGDNVGRDAYLKTKIRSIDEIEERTGINFFPNMPSAQQAEIEAGKATSLNKWFTF